MTCSILSVLIFLFNLNAYFAKVATDSVYLAIQEQALARGIPKEFLIQVFSAPSIEIHEDILEQFIQPYERKTWPEYRKMFVTESRIDNGCDFYFEHRELLENAAEKYKVNPCLILSIIGVESNYGRHHKQYAVFNALYTQAAAMPKRAVWAQRELVEFLDYCHQNSVAPHTVFGSYAGAYGYGQFIPSSFNHYAVDFDGDGVRQAYSWPDVIGSVANYLIKNSYPVGDDDNWEKVYKAVFAYNHSDNYVRAVLELQDALQKVIQLKLNNDR